MTLDEAKKIAHNIGFRAPEVRSPYDEALLALVVALDAAEGQVVQMREDAAKAVGLLLKEPALDGDPSFESGVVATIAHAQKAIRALPAPAVAPVNQCDGCRSGAPLESPGRHRQGGTLVACDAARYVPPVAAPKLGPTWETATQRAYKPDPAEVVAVSTFRPPFDAEAALVAMKSHLFVKNSSVHPTPEADRVLFYALEIGIAAGRGGGR